MFDIEPWTHAEHVNPMPHGGLDVAHHIPILDHSAKEPTHAVSPLCCSLTTVLWKWSNRLIPFWAKRLSGVLYTPFYLSTASSNALASWRSAVSNPSVNQP